MRLLYFMGQIYAITKEAQPPCLWLPNILVKLSLAEPNIKTENKHSFAVISLRTR